MTLIPWTLPPSVHFAATSSSSGDVLRAGLHSLAADRDTSTNKMLKTSKETERERQEQSMEGESATTTKSNRWGYPVRTNSSDCIAAINSFYHHFLTYGRNRAVILQAPLCDPNCVLANTLAADFLASKDPAKSSSFLAAAASLLENGTAYEKSVFAAVSALVGDTKDEEAAIDRHFELLKEFPKDLVSLKRVQLLCFYLGRPDLSLNFVEQVLAQNHDQSYIYGMLSFPLLELGRMAEAEKAARKGYEINKSDLWSQHNLCHVLQYECRFKEAVDFMESCSSTWSFCSSFMFTHNWWHVAVCYLEGHSPLYKVIEIYDHYIWKELQRSDAEYVEVYVNALGLLLRIDVRGHKKCIEDRIMVLADIFEDESSWHMEWLLDILGLWALACRKESTKAADLLKSMESRVCQMSKKKQQRMQSGLKLAEAIYEYGRGNYLKAFDALGPDFNALRYKMIGASDEQLDVFNEVWYSVLLHTGKISKAIEEIEKAIKTRAGIPFLWRLLERAYAVEGASEACAAAEKAKALETAYFK